MSVHDSSWLCNSKTQSKCSNQTHRQAIILILLSFQLVPQFPLGLKFSSSRADHPPLWSAQLSTGRASLWSEQPSRSLWWVPGTLSSSQPWEKSGRRWWCHAESEWSQHLPSQGHFCNWRALICPTYLFRLKYLSKVKMQRTPYQIHSILGPKHKNCAKKVTKQKTCSSHFLSPFALPCRKDSSTSASSSLWRYFLLQG